MPPRLAITQPQGRPDSVIRNALIAPPHCTLEFELQSLKHFGTKAAARAKLAALIKHYNGTSSHSGATRVLCTLCYLCDV
jgi:hypothetical protein